MRASIKDIAEYVGVSKSLVSIYLNRHPLSARIADKTKLKIDEAVKKFNYSPLATARALSKGKTKTIGLVVGDIAGVYSSFSADVILREASERGYQLLLAATQYNLDEERSALENLLNRQADGILYMLDFVPDERLKELLQGYPILQCNSKNPDFNAYMPETETIVDQVLRKFKEQNIRKIAIYGGKKTVGFFHSRLSAYGLEGHIICDWEYSGEHLYNEINREHCDGLLSDSSIPVRIFLTHCMKAGVRNIPRCIYSYSMPYNYMEHEAIIGVWHTPLKELIHARMDRIIEMIEHPDGTIRHLGIACKFFDRDGLGKLFREQVADPYFAKIVNERANIYNFTKGIPL